MGSLDKVTAKIRFLRRRHSDFCVSTDLKYGRIVHSANIYLIIILIMESKSLTVSGIPRNFIRGRGGGSTNTVEERGQREQRSEGGSPLVRGSGGSCNFVQEISFHIVRFF